jgi:uncharacterized protein
MSALNWFEIPAENFDRAVSFYSTILAQPLRTEDFNGVQNAIFPYEPGKGVGGAVMQQEGYTPSMSGTVVYLNTGTVENLDAVLARVDAAGGQVLLPKTHIGDPGYIAMIRDTEGNRVGLNGE